MDVGEEGWCQNSVLKVSVRVPQGTSTLGGLKHFN